MRLTRLLACLPVLAIVIATGCADGPLEGVRPVKYVKIEDANATTSKDPPPKALSARKDPPPDEKPATATTSAASSSTESVEPDELINAAAGKKPAGKGGKPPKPVGGSEKKPAAGNDFGNNPPTDDKCYRKGKDCCGDAIAASPKEKSGSTAKECPKGTVPGGSCPKKKCNTKTT